MSSFHELADAFDFILPAEVKFARKCSLSFLVFSSSLIALLLLAVSAEKIHYIIRDKCSNYTGLDVGQGGRINIDRGLYRF